jgi:hypothetical protein
MVYTGGSSEYCVQYVSGGYVIDDVSTRLSCRGGDAGGVAGRPPGEQNGMCLLGIAAGVPRVDVLSDRCGGGVGDRVGTGSALATAAAMLAVERGRWGAVEGTQREQSTGQMANGARTMDDNIGQRRTYGERVPKVWCGVNQRGGRVKEGKSSRSLRPFGGGVSLQRGDEHLVERSEVSKEMQSELICGLEKKEEEWMEMEGHWALEDVALVMRRVSGSIPRYLTPHASHHAPVDACPHTKFCGWTAQRHTMRADLSLLPARRFLRGNWRAQSSEAVQDQGVPHIQSETRILELVRSSAHSA